MAEWEKLSISLLITLKVGNLRDASFNQISTLQTKLLALLLKELMTVLHLPVLFTLVFMVLILNI